MSSHVLLVGGGGRLRARASLRSRRLGRVWRWVDALAFYGYAWFLVLPGGVLGLLVPQWGPLPFEVFANGIFDAPLSDTVLASALNQYRYMKSMEFGFGLFSLLFRERIYRERRFNRFYLGIVVLGAAERALSVVVDGTPRPFYVAAIFVELAVAAIVFLSSRATLREASAPP